METAAQAGLRYVDDRRPGIVRKRAGRGFVYYGPGGARISDPKELSRIRKLAIPPAYEHVWICPQPNGHIQATGRDARGRKQYRYHPRWREARDETKYHRMLDFARALPRIRKAVDRDLALPGLPREKVLATVVRLLESTRIRVGNEEYARDNGSFGLTTLRPEHVAVRGAKVRFRFRGKSGVHHDVSLEDPRLARIVKRCQDLPGEELFRYLDADKNVVSVTSEEVNDYVRAVAGEEFSAKDFRTWAGTVACVALLRRRAKPAQTLTEAKAQLREVLGEVAGSLGNTVAVCRKCYVHPAVIEAFVRDKTLPTPQRVTLAGLSAEERDTVALVTELERPVNLEATLEASVKAAAHRGNGTRRKRREAPASADATRA